MHRSILDGRGGDDVIVTGSGRAQAKGGDGNDVILAGSGNAKVDGDKGTDIFAFYDHTVAWKIDLSDEDSGGYGLAKQGDEDVRIKDVEVFYGGDQKTTFIGSGKGKGSTFIAGTGGAKFTLTSGDRAFGFTGEVDEFYIDAGVPDWLGSKTSAEKISYLESNKIYVGNFGSEDKIFIKKDGVYVLFNGNKITTALLGEDYVFGTDRNLDVPHKAVVMTGDSSYGTAYASAVFEPRGLSWDGVTWGALVYHDMQVRDVSYEIADETGLGLMTFTSRGITGREDGGGAMRAGDTGYNFNELTENDEQLTVVIDGFQSGYGGIAFEQDAGANVLRPTQAQINDDDRYSPISYNFQTHWAGAPAGFNVNEDQDIFDGNSDGYMYPGGALINSDDPNFNFGYKPYEGENLDWDAFLSGPKNIGGTSGPDSIEGGDASDVLSGGDDDDLLIGGAGNDLLDGGAGNDVIWGGDGNDTLIGGTGNDLLIGEAGRNIIDGGDGLDVAEFGGAASDYLIHRNLDGTVVVKERYDGSGGILTNVESLHFSGAIEDIDVVDLPMGTGGNDVLVGSERDDLIDGGAGDDNLSGGDGDDIYVVDSVGDVVIENEFEGTDTVRTSLAAYTLGSDLEDLVFIGTGAFAGTGNTLDNRIEGGAGNDTLAGDEGDDRFVAGGGADVIDGGDGWDMLELSGKAGDYVYSTDGLGVTTISDGTNSIQLTNVEEVSFSKDDTYEVDKLTSMFIVGTSGNDAMIEGDGEDNKIRGLGGDDNLRGGDGYDILDGGDGNDTAHFVGDSGDYLIFYNSRGGLVVGDSSSSEGMDWLSNIESLRFDGDSVTIAVSTVAPLGTSGDDTITGSNRPDQLYGLAGNDNLSGGDGIDYLYGGAGNDTLGGGSGNDALYGGAGNDSNIFGTGDDMAWDEAGDDSYVYELGGGADRIRDDSGVDMLILGAGIVTGGVTMSVDGDDIVMTFAAGGSITIQDGLLEGSAIEEVHFADSTIWNPIVQLRTSTSGNDNLVGSALADTISGGAGNDIIDGRLGDDTLSGDGGSDTLSGSGGDDNYLFALGDGEDIIREFSGTSSAGIGGSDSLIFAAGIDPTDVVVSLASSGRNLVLTVTGTTDKVTLVDSAYSADYNVETVRFADNTVWTHADLMTMALTPTSGNDTLYGSFAADVISGGAGNDTIMAREGDDILTGGIGNDNITGGTGNDIYRFGVGDGQDYISDYTSDVETSLDAIEFGVGILPADIVVTQADSGWDLVLSIAGTSDKITINDAAFATGYRIEEIRFADSTVWTHTDLMAKAYGPRSTGDTYWGSSDADVISGGAGNDTLLGSGGNDTLTGGEGNDTLNGGSGTNDIGVLTGLSVDYSMVAGGGILSVTDNAPTVSGNDGTDSLTGVEKLRFSNGQEIGIAAPIILDLDGNGVTTMSANASKALYDMDGDGRADDTSWMGSGEGMLFLDRDGNGTLSNAGEFSFVNDVEGAASDLAGLRAFDSDGDGQLSSTDTRFADFRVWRDRNGDGAVQGGEVMTLGTAGVASLNLNGTAVSGATAIGNVAVIHNGSYTKTDGGTMNFIDAAFTYFSGPPAPQASGTARFFAGLWNNLLASKRNGSLSTSRREMANDWGDWSNFSGQRLGFNPSARELRSDAEMTGADTLETPTDTALRSHVAPGGIDQRLALIVQEMANFGAQSAGEGPQSWQRGAERPVDFFA